MATLVSAGEIPPGGEAKIDVTVNTAGRMGPLEKTITVYCNDPRNPTYPLKVSGTVDLIASFEPLQWELRNIAKGSATTQTFKQVGSAEEREKLAEITPSLPDKISAEATEVDGKPALKVTVKAGQALESLSGVVTAKTGLDYPKEIQLTIHGQVSEDLVLDRLQLFFAQSTPKSEQTTLSRAATLALSPWADNRFLQKVRVSSLGAKPFEITQVEDPTGAVIGKVQKDGDRAEVLLALSSSAGTDKGIIRLHTNRPEQPVIEIKYLTRNADRPMFRPLSKLLPGLHTGASGVRLPPGVKPLFTSPPIPPKDLPAEK